MRFNIVYFKYYVNTIIQYKRALMKLDCETYAYLSQRYTNYLQCAFAIIMAF